MTEEKKTKLSIIVNHYRTPDVLKMCLDSIKKYVKGIDYEIIVGDSATQEQTANMMQEYYPDILFMPHDKNVGFAGMVNPAIKKARGEFLFIINADIIALENGGVEKMIEYLEKNPEIGILGPKLLNIDGSLQQTYFREYNPFIILTKRTVLRKTRFGKKMIDKFNYKDKGDIKSPLPVTWLMASAYLIKKDRFQKVGPFFDSRFFMYFEDTDLSRRFREKSMKVVYYPEVQFTHHHTRQSFGGKGLFDVFTNKLTRVHIGSYIKYIWKWKIVALFGKSKFFKS